MKWYAMVCLATNFESVEPLQNVRRFSQSLKRQVTVTQPNLISSHNKYMGGVDLHDNFVSKYRIKVKEKKWWWLLFVNLLDSPIVNV